MNKYSSNFQTKKAKLRAALVTVGLGISALALVVLISQASTDRHPVNAFSKQTEAAGAIVFREKGCQHCHGDDGVGTDRGPDLSSIGKRWKNDRIEHQIRVGGDGMPAFGDVLQPDEIKSLVDYLHAKRKPHAKTPAPPPPAPPKSNPDDSGL